MKKRSIVCNHTPMDPDKCPTCLNEYISMLETEIDNLHSEVGSLQESLSDHIDEITRWRSLEK